MDGQVELSRRERQIMDVVYGRGEASASDVIGGIADPPGRAAVRTLLRILETISRAASSSTSPPGRGSAWRGAS